MWIKQKRESREAGEIRREHATGVIFQLGEWRQISSNPSHNMSRGAEASELGMSRRNECMIRLLCPGLACLLSCFTSVWPFATPWTVAHQASLPMEFSRQEYWSGFPWLLQGIFPTQRSNLSLLPLQVGSLPLSPQGSPSHDLDGCVIFFNIHFTEQKIGRDLFSLIVSKLNLVLTVH